MINIALKNRIFSHLPAILKLNSYKFYQSPSFCSTKLSMNRSNLMINKNRFSFCNNKDNKKENK